MSKAVSPEVTLIYALVSQVADKGHISFSWRCLNVHVMFLYIFKGFYCEEFHGLGGLKCHMGVLSKRVKLKNFSIPQDYQKRYSQNL